MAEKQKIEQKNAPKQKHSAPKKRLTKAQKRRILRRRRLKISLGMVAVLALLIGGVYKAHQKEESGIVSAHQLKSFGWKEELSHTELNELNHLLEQYEITSKPSLTMFFATVASETDGGRLVLETGGDAHYAAHGYTANERGAGYLQITHRPKQLEFLNAVDDPFQGADTASYIAEKYPWESACWMWSVGKTSPAPNPNEYAKTRGNTPEVFLATQYGINGWTISNDALGKIVQGADYTVSEDGKTITVEGKTSPAPKNWLQRLEWYEKAKKIWG